MTPDDAQPAEIAPALVMDERGVLCPLPIIHLAQQIGDVEIGEVIELLADDPAAASDIPAWCSMREQRYVGKEIRVAYTAYWIERLR